MISAADIARWIEEGAPALLGSVVHRVWRAEEAWVLLCRHHEGGDPDRRATRRVALELALAGDWARCVALPPEAVGADDGKRKKAWARDGHPFLGLLRKHLVGCRVESLAQVAEDRVVWLGCQRDVDPDAPQLDAPSRRPLLAVELIGRTGNLILCERGAPPQPGVEESPRVVGSLNAGRAGRPFERGGPYRLPPARPQAAPRPATLATDVAPDSETLALGLAVADQQRALAAAARRDSRQGELGRAARRAIKRAEGLLAKLANQLAETAQADRYEREGDLLKANLQRIPRGAGQVTLEDYDPASGEPVDVVLELDPTQTAKEQMKRRYKRAKKLRSGEVNIQLRQGETDAQLAELRELAAALQDVDPADEAALDRLEAGLRKLGALPQAKPKRAKQQANQGPRSFRTREGHEVLVGRSDEENDRLTMRVARGRDLFFHVRGCPGSHVILRVDRERPPNHESILDAACLAVHYSKARQRGRVDVSYTPRKWVMKPRGAKPGLVRISNEKTVKAGADPERLQRVLDTLRREER